MTAVNRNNKNDNRVSELEVWERCFDKEEKKCKWWPLGKKSAKDVAKLLAEGRKVFSGEEKETLISLGDEIEFFSEPRETMNM